MDYLQSLAMAGSMPFISAFILGLLMSMSPCPLATNIAAIAYLSKDLQSPKKTFINGLFYTLGRAITYTALATVIYFGISAFTISSIFQGWGDKVLGPILIVIGLVMLDIIKINISGNNRFVESTKVWLAGKGYLGSILLGALFALAFCPYSGVIFFGMLMPLIVNSNEGLLLAPIFSLGTGIPVIIFAAIIAFGMKSMGKAFGILSKVEVVVRKTVGVIFIIVGVYYLQYLVKYISEVWL